MFLGGRARKALETAVAQREYVIKADGLGGWSWTIALVTELSVLFNSSHAWTSTKTLPEEYEEGEEEVAFFPLDLDVDSSAERILACFDLSKASAEP